MSSYPYVHEPPRGVTCGWSDSSTSFIVALVKFVSNCECGRSSYCCCTVLVSLIFGDRLPPLPVSGYWLSSLGSLILPLLIIRWPAEPDGQEPPPWVPRVTLGLNETASLSNGRKLGRHAQIMAM